jgi:hypothetical protein
LAFFDPDDRLFVDRQGNMTAGFGGTNGSGGVFHCVDPENINFKEIFDGFFDLVLTGGRIDTKDIFIHSGERVAFLGNYGLDNGVLVN